MMAESKPASARKLLSDVCFGALVALVVGYAACYVCTHFGVGVIEASGKAAGGRSVFSRAAINLYAMQHVTLVGGNEDVFAAITVPLSLWAILPALALILGGYCAASSSGARGRGAMMACAICAGVLYAVILAAASRVIHTRIDSFLMPEISGYGSNPQEFPFRPATRMALIYAGLFGVIFAYLGALIAIRKSHSHESPGKWWACVKSVVVVALVIQLILIGFGGFRGMFSSHRKQDEADQGRQFSVVELIPTAAGIGYSIMHGATLVAGAESFMRPTKETRKPFYARVSLFKGVIRDDVGEKSRHPIASWVVALALALAALAAMLMGRLAVCWGSRDGSLPTALRIAFIHTAYLGLLVSFCGAALLTTDMVSVSAVIVNLRWGMWLLYSFLGVFVFSLLGATTASRRPAPMEP